MIDFYTSATANGQKVAIMLEECGLDYVPHIVDLSKGEHKSEAFLKLNPGGKIPAIVDSDGPGGETLMLSQSMAIILYLAEKTGLFLPSDARARAEVYRYMSIVSTDISAAFTGMFIFGVMAPQPGPFPLEFFQSQAERQLRLLDQRLAESRYLAGDEYSAADIIAYPVASTSSNMLPNKLTGYDHLRRWADEVGARPAVQRGLMAAPHH
jgi:GST-like protein